MTYIVYVKNEIFVMVFWIATHHKLGCNSIIVIYKNNNTIQIRLKPVDRERWCVFFRAKTSAFLGLNELETLENKWSMMILFSILRATLRVTHVPSI